MKKSILLIFMMLFALAGIISAQTNTPDYYTGITRIIGDNYVYNIHYPSPVGLRVSNEKNTIINTKPPQLTEKSSWITAYVRSSDTENYFMSIAPKEIEALSHELKTEKPKPRGIRTFNNSLSAMIAVNPRTEEILEVYFSCHNTPATKAIHPDKFYQLEQYIKQNINVPLDVFTKNEDVKNELRKCEWILTKIPFFFDEMYPL